MQALMLLSTPLLVVGASFKGGGFGPLHLLRRDYAC